MGLELYSKVEELFLDKEAAYILWSKFLEILKNRDIKEVLDIGCGSGKFCLLAKENKIEIKGIDLSKNQVLKAKNKGCDCEVRNVCEIKKEFECCVAIFDVINYMNKDELKNFFNCVEKITKKYFIFDINTFFAMNDLAVGTLKAEDANRFSCLYSEFEANKLITEITLFEKEGNCYKKHQKSIIQYYYSLKEIEDLTNFKTEEVIPISLYSNEIEKLIVVMKRV